jgi:hypothetical protein
MFTSDMEKATTRASVFVYVGDGENLEGPIFLTPNMLSKESGGNSRWWGPSLSRSCPWQRW